MPRLAERLRGEIEALDAGAESAAALEARCEAAKRDYFELAAKLSRARRTAARALGAGCLTEPPPAGVVAMVRARIGATTGTPRAALARLAEARRQMTLVAPLPALARSVVLAEAQILRDAGILGREGATAEPSDLILALRAADAVAGEAALATARALIDQPATSGGTGTIEASRTIRAATQRLPAANLALISVPGDFAIAEARKALALGLHVMIFSDNVPLADEGAGSVNGGRVERPLHHQHGDTALGPLTDMLVPRVARPQVVRAGESHGHVEGEERLIGKGLDLLHRRRRVRPARRPFGSRMEMSRPSSCDRCAIASVAPASTAGNRPERITRAISRSSSA